MPLQDLILWQTLSQSTCLHCKGWDDVGRFAGGLRMIFLQELHDLDWVVGPGLLSMSPASRINNRRTAAGS